MDIRAVDSLIDEASEIIEHSKTPLYEKDRLQAIQEFRRMEAKSAEKKSRNLNADSSTLFSVLDEVSEFKEPYSSFKVEHKDQNLNQVQQELLELELSPITLPDF